MTGSFSSEEDLFSFVIPSNQRLRVLSADGVVRTMSIVMPPSDAGVLARRADIVRALRSIVPGEGVIEDVDALRPYEADGLTADRQPPMVVVLPETTEQVSRIVAWCHAEGVKVVPRGSGTSLSGGALPLADAVLVGM